MYGPIDPNRLIGRSVVLATDDGEHQASVRAVGPAGISLDVRGHAILLQTDEIDRLRPI